MSAYKEIVTKAVVGKGKKYYKNSYKIDVGTPVDTVLGAWIINHKFKGKDTGKKIEIEGSFDVNLWYSHENDTKTSVITKTLTYNDSVTVSQRETVENGEKDIIVRSLKGPSCISAKEDNSNIIIDIEKELGVEIVGDTKVKIAIEDGKAYVVEGEEKFVAGILTKRLVAKMIVNKKFDKSKYIFQMK